MEEAVKQRVKKVVYTGAATSVVGEVPSQENGFVYRDNYHQVDAKLLTQPNEKAKFLAERVSWLTIKK